MNENSIKWIALNGMELSPINLSLPEKLNKFGYGIVFDEFGEDKAVKAQLCIFDVLRNKDKANILIICPQRFMQSWYSSLLLGLGADFKYVIPSADSIMFFSKEMSNFYIMGEDALKSNVKNPVLDSIEKSGVAWDLMIIDASSSCDGMDVELYTNGIGSKTDKLIIFAPYPSSYNGPVSAVRDIVKKVLLDEEKSKGIDFFTVDSTVLEFGFNTPFMKYPSHVRAARRLNSVSYSYDKAALENTPKIDDSQLPEFRGGNFFEEYSPEERKTFMKPSYKKPDVDELRAVDKKLDKLLELAAGIIDDSEKTALIYFDSDDTLNYIYKSLIAVYPDKKPLFRVLNNSVSEVGRFVERYVADGGAGAPKIILATDCLDETCAVYTPITSIINYELPASPSVLQQRYMRKGCVPDEAEFVLLLDENGIFDRRVLEKVLCGNFYKAFNHSIPSENVLFNVEGASKMITDMLLDIKYISDYTGSVGSSFDVITRFKSDYNIPDSRNLTTAARTHEYAKRKLLTLSSALGLGNILLEKDVNRDALQSVIAEKTAMIRDGYSLFDDANELKTVGKGIVRNGHFEAFANDIKANVYVAGLEEAKKQLDTMLGDGKDFPYVKSDVNSLTDSLRNSVLYNIWAYYNAKGIKKSYKEFIRAYNEGVI